MKKSLAVLALAAATALTGAAAHARSNIYNEAGTRFSIVTPNYTQSYNLGKDSSLKFGDQAIGTWIQTGTGTGDTPFWLAVGENKVKDGGTALIIHAGSYNIETGACSLMRMSNDANNGTKGVCAFAPIGTPVAWMKCADEGQTCNMGGAPMEVRYGANGGYVTLPATSDTFECTNAFFGSDPAPNVVKTCEVR